MPTNLTGTTIASTFNQLLHVDEGPAAGEKIVYSGTGVPTALRVGTESVSVENIRLDGNIISTLTGNLTLAPVGNVGIANASITGGSITGITDLAIADGGTGASTAADARSNLGLGTMATQNANSVNITGGTISGASVSVPFGSVTGRAFGSFSDTTDQTGNVSTPTAVIFNTDEINSNGITRTNDGGGNPTRITFAAAGTYMIAFSLQLTNSDNSGHSVKVWLRENGADMPRTATKIAIPKSSDGGSTFFNITYYEQVTAGSYIQVMWLPDNAAVTLDHTAADAGPPAIPAIPSAILVAERIA